MKEVTLKDFAPGMLAAAVECDMAKNLDRYGSRGIVQLKVLSVGRKYVRTEQNRKFELARGCGKSAARHLTECCEYGTEYILFPDMASAVEYAARDKCIREIRRLASALNVDTCQVSCTALRRVIELLEGTDGPNGRHDPDDNLDNK